MLRNLVNAVAAVLLVATAVAVLVVSPLARPAVALLPSFATALPAMLLASCC
jgi:hypothetical protein